MIYFDEKNYEPIVPFDMSKEEFFFIAKKLEEYNTVFSSFWRMGIPIFCNTYGFGAVDSAEVHFDKDNNAIKIYINPYLWNRLDEEQKLFIICHECLHVVFNYAHRVLNMKNQNLANIAADTAINQILVKNFLFDKKTADPENELCWNDSGFFSLMKNVETMQTMEYYYNLLVDGCEEGSSSKKGNKNGPKNSSEQSNGQNGDEEQGGGSEDTGDNEGGEKFILGNHNNLSEEDCQTSEDMCKKLNESMSLEEKESIREMVEANCEEEDIATHEHTPGKSAGGIWLFVEKQKVKHKKKWETVIKKWANTQIKEDRRDIEQWATVNRRFVLLNKDLTIPSEMEMDANAEDKKKIEVWFFQDTSGSCSGYTKRFFTAAESLPPKRFDVKMHCFDTRVYETTLESRKLYGFGGTAFHIIENYIQKTIRRKKDYPKAVFVITDGYAGPFHCAHPERWYWFITPGGSKSSIPSGSNIFDLKDYE